jgi:hypothetical protein
MKRHRHTPEQIIRNLRERPRGLAVLFRGHPPWACHPGTLHQLASGPARSSPGSLLRTSTTRSRRKGSNLLRTLLTRPADTGRRPQQMLQQPERAMVGVWCGLDNRHIVRSSDGDGGPVYTAVLAVSVEQPTGPPGPAHQPDPA